MGVLSLPKSWGLILNPAYLPTVSAGEETSPLRFVGLGIGVFWLGFDDGKVEETTPLWWDG